MKKKIKQLNIIMSALMQIPIKDAKGLKINDDLTTNLVDFINNNQPVFQDIVDKKNKIELDFCYTNEQNVIEYDILPNGTRTYKYTREGLQKRDVELKKMGEKLITLTPCLSPVNDRINELPMWIKETLNGLIWQMDLKQ